MYAGASAWSFSPRLARRAEAREFRRYLNEESLARAKGWEWEPLP